jgi:cobalt/nickel transport system permease protein
MAVILLGPWSAIIIMSLVLIAQCLIFQDGGLLALGANIFNMAIVASLSAYLIYRVAARITGVGRYSTLIAGFTAAWVSVLLASAACSAELAFSGTAPLGTILPAMTGVHALIGIGEGLATVAVLSLIRSVRGNIFSTVAELNSQTAGSPGVKP